MSTKVKMLGGYGDIDAGTYVNFADDAEAARHIENNAARPIATEKNFDEFKGRRDAFRHEEYVAADEGATFIDFPPAPASNAGGKGKPVSAV